MVGKTIILASTYIPIFEAFAFRIRHPIHHLTNCFDIFFADIIPTVFMSIYGSMYIVIFQQVYDL